jgi:PPOX class probable F420-dependent enzyme
MTSEEAWARIDSAHTGIITSLRRDGMPIALPMWFCVVDAAVHFRTLARSKKAARLRHDPRVSFLVEGGERWAELWAVHLAGTAVFVDDDETHEKVQAALTAKYSSFRTDRSKMADTTRTHYEQEHVFVRIDAEERIVSWENAKLGLGDA